MRCIESILQDEIRGYIERTFLLTFDGAITPDSDLFDANAIDSYGFIELVTHLEATYHIKLTDDDLISAEMSTLAGMVRLVSKRREARGE